MNKPKLVDMSEFEVKPKMVSPKDTKLHSVITKNLLLILVILLGFIFVYYKYSRKESEKVNTVNKVHNLNNYVMMNTMDRIVDKNIK